MSKMRASGFSLVELLITLTIMGVVAACTIPPLFRVPAAKSNTKYTTMARDTAFMVMTAYEQYRAATPSVATTVTMNNLTPYMNYVSVDSTSTIDQYNGFSGGQPCSAATYTCLKLHNGSIIMWTSIINFYGTSSTNSIFYFFDPDGVQTDLSTTNGPGKAMVTWLQYDGEVHSWGTLPANINYMGSIFSASPQYDPNWFTGF